MRKWEKKLEAFARAHETAISWLLVGVAIVLLAVAFFGDHRHKAAALCYIIL